MMKLQILLLLLAFISIKAYSQNGNDFEVSSPDGKISLKVLTRQKINYSVSYQSKMVIDPSPISLSVKDFGVLGMNPQILNTTKESMNAKIETIWGNRKWIPDIYNSLSIELLGGHKIQFRVYNDAVAYRFELKFKNKIQILDEEVAYCFPSYPKGWLSVSNSYETSYEFKDLFTSDAKQNIYLPTILEVSEYLKISLLESDVIDYPSLQLRNSGEMETKMLSHFELCPKSVKVGGFNNYCEVPVEMSNYIANTDGTRNLPWRIILLASQDKDLVYNDIVYKLAKPAQLQDVSWIKPGKVAWDWWHDYATKGVDFQGGVNTATYLYEIDFAAQHKLEYIIVDWKWTDKYDLTLTNPEIDMKKIVDYGKQKNVAVIVWCPAYTLNRQLDVALDFFAKQGIAGIKVDFFDRADQQANQMYERIAIACAKRKMVVDFHGAVAPTGLSRAYPNILNYEAVLGNENNKWSNKVTPEHEMILPFTRMLAGPIDFTPGGMRNCIPGNFVVRNTLPFVQGTRCHEMALFVLYNEPLKMLCDAPHVYNAEPDVIKFLSEIPTVWDETIVNHAKVSDYLVASRQKGEVWYVGALTDASSRNLQLQLDFLPTGNYKATIFSDGINISKDGSDYKITDQQVNNLSVININMAASGGCVIRIQRI